MVWCLQLWALILCLPLLSFINPLSQLHNLHFRFCRFGEPWMTSLWLPDVSLGSVWSPSISTLLVSASTLSIYVSFGSVFISLSISHWLTMYVCIYVCYQTFLTNFGALYLTEFLTDLGLILDSNSYDQAQQTLWYHTTPRP